MLSFVKMNRKNIIFLLTLTFSMAIMFGTSDAENPSPGGNAGGHPGGHPGANPYGNPNGQSGGAQSACSLGGYSMDISYESLDPASQKMLKTQLTRDVFEGFAKCCITLKLWPCSFSKVVNGKLTCANGENECNLDRMFACATKLNECDMNSVGKFVIAMFAAGNQIGSAKNIAASNGLKNWDAIEKCSKSSDADKYCQEYHEYREKNEGPDQSSNSPIASNFTKFLCDQMKQQNLSCPLCGGGACGSGNGANASGGGAHGGGDHNGGGGHAGH